jgi:hypothetical protein
MYTLTRLVEALLAILDAESSDSIWQALLLL